jgi:hypothetical protein
VRTAAGTQPDAIDRTPALAAVFFVRLNAEWIHLNKCPVGYTAVPYRVGGNGDVFHTNFEMNF